MSKQIICRSCGCKFTLTERQIEFYAENGWSTPCHCTTCRKEKRQERASQYYGLYDAIAKLHPMQKAKTKSSLQTVSRRRIQMKRERLCLDCGCYFTISLGEIKKLKAIGKHIPTHCPMCRERRWKEERQRIRQATKFERKIIYGRF